MGDTSIEWTDKTWNPVRGCSRVSPGCENCYAESVARRFSGPGLAYEGLADERGWTRKVRMVPEHLADPLRWRKPCRVFVNSMSDLFHEGVTDEEIAAVFGVMAASPQHTFQILTKRAERMRQWFASFGPHRPPRATIATAADHFLPESGFVHPDRRRSFFRLGGGAIDWPLPNVWLGVSVENQKYADERIPELLVTPAAVRFVSYEPALGPVSFFAFLNTPLRNESLRALGTAGMPGLDWIIVGGESGHDARSFDPGWARSTVEQCRAAGVACFVKQLGSYPVLDARYDRTINGVTRRLVSRKGGDMEEWPIDLRVREFPR